MLVSHAVTASASVRSSACCMQRVLKSARQRRPKRLLVPNQKGRKKNLHNKRKACPSKTVGGCCKGMVSTYIDATAGACDDTPTPAPSLAKMRPPELVMTPPAQLSLRLYVAGSWRVVRLPTSGTRTGTRRSSPPPCFPTSQCTRRGARSNP